MPICVLRLAPALLLAVAACAEAEDLNEPLSAPMVRQQITGRTFTGLDGNQRFFITFERNGAATYYGATTEYVHWRADRDGLCIKWYDAAAEKCAPVYLAGYESYRVGTITMQEFALPHRF
jgi:hypothetical protein